MAKSKYCSFCERPVQPKRRIGIGTLILVLITSGLWVFLIVFYRKRCPICSGTGLMSTKDAIAMRHAQQSQVTVNVVVADVSARAGKPETSGAPSQLSDSSSKGLSLKQQAERLRRGEKL